MSELALLTDLKNKKIALIGNAKSIFNSHKDIDQYDIIIRMNKGFPRGAKDSLGSRTDILALSLNLDKETIQKEYDPKFIIWCTPENREFVNHDWLKFLTIFYPMENWNVLNETLKSRPSTGCMMIDFLYNYIDFAELHLYGFDFWETPNWYTNTIHIDKHDPEAEQFYVNELVKNNERIIYHE